MLVPKLRFKREDGTSYPDIESLMLGERFTFKNGINASREAFRAEGIQCIGVSDVVKCLPITAKNVKGTVAISEEEIKKNIVNYGDILFQRSSETKEDIGHASVYYDNTPAVYNGFVICAKPDKLFYAPIYLHYALQHSRIRKQTVTLGAGTGQHYNIGQEGLSKIKVIFPCLEEQRKIAEFLSNIDEAIDQSETEVQNLKQQKKAVIQKLFSRDIRFKREDGTKYPEWSNVKLSSILYEYTETCEKDGTYEHISLTKEGVVPKSERYERDFLVTNESKKYRVTHLDDICYNPANLKFGVICRNKYRDGIFSPIYVTFKVQSGFLPAFIELMVTRNEFINYALRFQQGTVYERMAVSPEDLLSITVAIPCFEEQQIITDFLSAYDKSIDYAEQELNKWKELKKGLLQQMFI